MKPEQQEDLSETEISETEEPHEFICSLTMEIMRDPVVSRYGQNFEREAIFNWLARGNDSCPMTRNPLRLSDLITNHQLRARIRRWQLDNQMDVAVITDDTNCQFKNHHCFGILYMPEADPDPTDRPTDDLDVEEHRSTTRNSRRGLGRIMRENGGRARRGVFNMFRSRRGAAA